MSPSRMVVLVVLSLTACKGEPGEPGPQGPMGLQGLQGPKGEPGAPGQTVKLPHLIVAATGEDLGLRTQFNCAWSDMLQGEVCFGASPYVFYSDPDCKGTEYSQVCFGQENTFRVYQNEAVAVDCTATSPIVTRSFRSADNRCITAPSESRPYFPLVRSGRRLFDVAQSDLRVDLR